MAMIPINGIELNYEVSGFGNPLFLIGGLTANCREWRCMIEHLAQHFTVYRPENRGSGETRGWGDAFSVEDMADDMAMLMGHLGIESAYVVGHSMGGAIAQRLCMRHPKRVKAAILASSFAHFPKAAQLYVENTSALFAAGLNPELVLQTIYTRLYGSDFLADSAKVQAEMQRMRTEPVPQTPKGYRAQVEALARFDARADLKAIQCPTLIINGHDDVLTPTHLSEELHHGIDASHLTIIAACGHMIPQEQPEALTQCIIDFFKQ